MKNKKILGKIWAGKQKVIYETIFKRQLGHYFMCQRYARLGVLDDGDFVSFFDFVAYVLGTTIIIICPICIYVLIKIITDKDF